MKTIYFTFFLSGLLLVSLQSLAQKGAKEDKRKKVHIIIETNDNGKIIKKDTTFLADDEGIEKYMKFQGLNSPTPPSPPEPPDAPAPPEAPEAPTPPDAPEPPSSPGDENGTSYYFKFKNEKSGEETEYRFSDAEVEKIIEEASESVEKSMKNLHFDKKEFEKEMENLKRDLKQMEKEQKHKKEKNKKIIIHEYKSE